MAMNREKFWVIIETILEAYDGSLESYVDELRSGLRKESLEDIMKWQAYFDAYMNLAEKEKLWAASYVMNGDFNEDGFEFFRAWMISLGEDMYYALIEEPDRLGDLEVDEPDEFVGEFEDILDVPLEIYAEKKEQSVDEVEEEFFAGVGGLLEEEMASIENDMEFPGDIDLEWDFEDEAQLKKLFPQTYAKFAE